MSQCTLACVKQSVFFVIAARGSCEGSGEELLGVLSPGISWAACKKTLDTWEPYDLHMLTWVPGM